MIVLDASALVHALVDDGPAGRATLGQIGGESRLLAPEIIDLEIASALRRGVRTGPLAAVRAETALAQLREFPLTRFSHHPLLARVWDLRENLTPYDAAYVALAEALEAPLLTADKRLASAPGLRCEVELIG